MRRLAAMAGLTVRAAVRLRVFWWLLGLLLIVVVVVPGNLQDDGTLEGHVRLLLTYPLGLSHGLLCVAAVWLACDTMAGDQVAGRIELLGTKPLPRWLYWLGKWVGLGVLLLLLELAVGCGVALQLDRALAEPRWSDSERAEVREKILVGRRAAAPILPDFAKLALEETDRRLRGVEDAGIDRRTVYRSALNDVGSDWQTVPPGERKVWQFEGLRPRSELRLRVRCRSAAYVDASGAPGRWLITGSRPAPESRREVRVRPDQFETLLVPAALVGPDGVLKLTFENRSGVALAFPPSDGPVMLYQVLGFGANYLIALGLLWLQTTFLAALGLAAAAAFSYQVAAFVSFSYLLAAGHGSLLSGQLGQARLFVNHHGQATAPGWVEAGAQAVLQFAVWLTAGLQRTMPLGSLTRGLVLPHAGLAALTLAAQIALVVVLGAVIWSTRELSLGAEQ